MKIVAERWIDIDGEEYKQVHDHAYIRRFILRSLELKAIKHDIDGKLFVNDASNNPIHVDHKNSILGLKMSAKAAN